MTSRFRSCSAAGVLLVLVACRQGSRAPVGSPAPITAGPALTEAWSWASPGGFSPGLPAVDGDDAAVTWSHQLLVLFDGAGSPRWQVQRLGLLEVAPTLTPTLVLAATDDGVVAYDRSTGRVGWETILGEQPTTPVVAGGAGGGGAGGGAAGGGDAGGGDAGGGKVVVATWEGSLVALEPADGKVAWRTHLGGPSLGPPAVAGGSIVATFDTGRAAGATSIDAATGRPRWTVPLPPDGVSAPAVTIGGLAVVVAADAAAHGLSLDDGSERWRTPLDGSGSPEVPPLALPDGSVVVGHRLGGMALLDGQDGARRWQSAPHGAAVRGGPVGPGPNGWFAMPLHDGRLLLAGADRRDALRNADGFVRGVAPGPAGTLLVGIGRGDDNHVMALRGW